MRRKYLNAATAAALLFFPGFAAAEDLTGVSDLDLIEKTREAVAVQAADDALELLTEMQRRGTGIFAGAERVRCEELIELPEGITDWRFKGAARQAYITAAKQRRIEDSACGCLFADYTFDAFTAEVIGKAPGDLVDADRAALETFLAEHQRETEARYRDFEKSCRAM